VKNPRTLSLVCLILVFYFATSTASFAQRVGSASSPVFKTLASFDGADGALSYFGSIIKGTDGNFYGTTSGGGLYAQGAVFKMTPGGALSTVYSFCAKPNCSDGADPDGGLVQASNGDFYGTTYTGGKYLYGTVFKLTTAGELTTLYSFGENTADGLSPHSGLLAFNGEYYGTTAFGGNIGSCGSNTTSGCGTIFKITAGGSFSTFYSFCSQLSCSDGATPLAGLIQYSGNLYGTTQNGGAYGDGTVFTITPSSTLTTLHSFGSGDGDFPSAILAAANGNLYGTTPIGGTGGVGTFFQISPTGQMTTLYNFNSIDGAYAYGGVTAGTDGNFYGTTEMGGAHGYGAVFEITPSGSFTTLHSFDLNDGAYPEGGLLQAAAGVFYGTTSYGGARLDGTVFSLSVVSRGSGRL